MAKGRQYLSKLPEIDVSIYSNKTVSILSMENIAITSRIGLAI